ncbi:chlorite dismutase family protein [Sediminicoccus sp. KRV36]|uniref:chlorite dismutase family protein n=1 Tax=Sediminicoccus sp. KRV36 TaxID=3133721 RepID=UPI00200FF131|nr:chlorite dismutase family protein [Sediminicoccus rosea]UPY39215.1 chlorite dismutase family protein [Sediminicoccus rosea]
MPPPLMVQFRAGDAGPWRIERMLPVTGAALPAATHLAILEGTAPPPPGAAAWSLRGSTGNLRYTHRSEADSLAARQAGLGRPAARCAALIPIRKNAAWWSLAQDERRAILEEESQHIAIGMEYLPAISRRLHHSRELGEPFDFITWFEYAPEHAAAFDEMLRRLRAKPEWGFVEREVDLRLRRLD